MSDSHRRPASIARLAASSAIITCSAWTAGCSLSGDWELADVTSPPQDGAPLIRAMSFMADGRYTVTEAGDGQPTTSTGRYTWNGLTLTLEPDQDGQRTYPCRLNWDLTMRLQDASPGQSWRATLRRKR